MQDFGCITALCRLIRKKCQSHWEISRRYGTFWKRDIPKHCGFSFLSKHYRSPLDFSFATMDDAEKGLVRVYECLAEVRSALQKDFNKKMAMPEEILKEFQELKQAFLDAMDDDFNTAAALGHVFGIVRLVNRVLEDKTLRGKDGTKAFLEQVSAEVNIWSQILGVFALEPADILLELRNLNAKRMNIDVQNVEDLLAQRLEAKKNKDFAKADSIRDTLTAMHVEVRDTQNGQVWAINYTG